MEGEEGQHGGGGEQRVRRVEGWERGWWWERMKDREGKRGQEGRDREGREERG